MPEPTRAMRPLSSVILSTLLAAPLCAQEPEPFPLLPDDPIVARLDELASMPWIKYSGFTTDTAHHNVHGFTPDQVPTWPDEVYAERVGVLNAATPFELAYNRPVRAFIDLYVERKREMSARMLGLAELYFPVFEAALDRHGIPLEMKYLAVVESALNPSARSRAGAVGLWQFMLPTGKMFGLYADSYIDERHDVYKSTEAACRYLKYLHRMYDDWEMAMAAYNCGPGNVNKAIRRSGGKKGYWDIYAHLPRETRGYVPAFIAVNYLFAHHADHNIYPIAPTYCQYEMDTVQVCYPLDLAALAERTGVARQDMLDMNPTFKRGIVPDVEQPVAIYLPKEAAGIMVANEETIRYDYIDAMQAMPKEDVAAVSQSKSQQQPVKSTHTVRRGESLGVIARRYGVTVRDLKHWNGLRGDMIRAGQRLVVHRDPKV
ncbi:MAG: transglycosylase SLT domain-containing protein [Flavobacteriales bacterium]|jgi:membrane-bound lytic murein transglycosylase D|nr:transglycosylase SLT domain-containing protein [Flavobacteriales bacterium]